MLLRAFASAAVAAAAVLVCGTASAADVTVLGTAGPWNPAISGNPTYGVGDQTAPTSIAVNAGDDITITYVSGATSAFGGVTPTVDALGYEGNIFGSGAVCGTVSPCTGVGSSGQPFPSSTIDPNNTGPQIALNALIGDFVNSNGVILDAFAPGDGPYSIVAPTGAVALQLGVNDDIYTFDNGALTTIDNSGALDISVTGSTAGGVPEPATWAMMILGLGLTGGMLRRRAGALAAA